MLSKCSSRNFQRSENLPSDLGYEPRGIALVRVQLGTLLTTL